MLDIMKKRICILLMLVIVFISASAFTGKNDSSASKYRAESASNVSDIQQRPYTEDDIGSSLEAMPENSTGSGDEGKAYSIKDRTGPEQHAELREKEKRQIIVKYRNETSKEVLKNRLKKNLKLPDMKTVMHNKAQKLEVLDIGDGADNIESVIGELQADSGVEYAQPNYRLEILAERIEKNPELKPNDSLKLLDTFDSLKGEIVLGEGIQAEEAHGLTKGSRAVVIGVLDSGVDIGHKDLSENIFTNEKEIPGNNIDDDNNGYIDDINGWDFVNDDSSIADKDLGIHGTQVAGIIAAQENGKGICGIAPEVKILPLKFINDRYGYTSDAIEAIEYAKAMGVSIINCSWGSSYYNPALKEAMESSGILFICAAGNGGQSVVDNPVYPACFDLPNILSVGATDENRNMLRYSNYGDEVDLAAPGENVLSTFPYDSYSSISGTSASAAYATGVAALLKSHGKEISPYDIVETMKYNVTKIEALEYKVNSGGVINAYKSLSNIILGAEVPQSEGNDPVNEQPVFDNLNEEMAVLDISNPFKYDKYNSGQYTKDMKDEVQKNDGSLNLNNNLLSLKGRNGLDLNLDLIYDSSKANFYDIDTQLSYKYVFGFYQVDYYSLNPVEYWDPYYFYYKGKWYGTTVEPEGLINQPVRILEGIIENDTLDGAVIDYNANYREYWANGSTTSSGLYYVAKLMAYGDITADYSGSRNITRETTYFDKTADIGAGWRWNFSSIETNGNFKYLHLPDGSIYRVNITSTEGDSNLYNYTLRDIRLETDTGSYSNGSLTSSYILFHKDGKKEYFDSDGKLIGIADRFGSQIKFEYNAGKSTLRKITDTIGRVINFTYGQGTLNKTLTISLSDGAGSNIVLTSEKVSGYTNEYTLKTIKDLEGRSTAFDYSVGTASFNFFSQDKPSIPSNNNVFANVSRVTYPTGAYSEYTYEKTTGNLGNLGTQEYYRVKTGKDCSGGLSYESRTYSYSSSNYTGYPLQADPENLPSNFNYVTMVIDGDNNYTNYVFDNKRLLKSVDKKEDNTARTNYVEYSYNADRMPVHTVERSYNKATGLYMERIEDYQYDSCGNLLYYWGPMANGDTSSAEYRTGYTYEPTYNYVTRKTYKKDSSTTIIEDYVPYSSDTRNVQWERIRENGVLKRQNAYTYDSYGNVTEKRMYKDGFSQYISEFYSYANGAYITRKWRDGVLDADGVAVQAKTGNNPGTIDENYSYDWYGNLIQRVDGNGNTILYQYDKLGRIKKQTNNFDRSFKEWAYRTDTQENSVTITNENWNSSLYSSYGSKIKLVYDGLGKLLYEQKYDKDPITGAEGFITINQYSYDYENRLDWEENLINGSVADYTYYKDGRLNTRQITNDRSGINVLLYNETLTYDDANNSGNYAKTTKVVMGDTNAPSITTTSYTDKMGRLNKQGRMYGSTEYADTFEYDYIGNRISEKSARAYNEPSLYTSCFYTSKYDYDFAGNILKITNVNGQFSTNEYDALGRLKKTTDYRSNQTSPAAYSTIYDYDNMGRLIKETIPFETNASTGNIYSAVKKHYYDRNGNTIQEMISNSKPGEAASFSKTQYEYNGRDMLTCVIKYDSATSQSYTQYYYDYSGNKLRMYTGLLHPLTITGLDNITENGDEDYSVTRYEYNRDNLLAVMVDPRGEDETYQYDLNGNITSKIDRNGNNTLYTYDGLSRVSSMSVSTSGVSGDRAYSYTYGKTGQKLSESDGSTSITSYTYDQLGRLTREIEGTARKDYTYDAANNRKSFRLTIGGTVRNNTTYAYDKLNRLSQVREGGVLEASYQYDANGNRISVGYANGNTESYSYNSANKIKDITNKKGSEDLSHYTYTYYLDGSREGETDSTSGNMLTYQYDGSGRLINKTETNNGSLVCVMAYGYNDYGNRMVMINITPQGYINTSYSYDKNNRLTLESKNEGPRQTSTSYYYDNNGNQMYKIAIVTSSIPGEPVTSRALSYSYDGFNQLTRVNEGNSIYEYGYNTKGLRTSKTVNGAITRHIWDGDQIALEVDGAGEVTAKYVRGINLIYAQDGAGIRKYYLYNAHGDVVQLTNASGDVIKDYEYDAFGNEKEPDPDDTNVFRYCGEYFDKETGTIYLRARYYDPGMGRFITEDSYWGEDSDPLSLNLYTYCGNDPINLIDPTGHWAESDSEYSTTVQIELLKLTFAWYMATSDKERNDIHNRAENIREEMSSGIGGILDKAKSISGAAADEFSWFLGGDVSKAERDYWLTQAQKYESNISISEKATLNASMFIIGILAPSPDDAIKMISKKASKEMYKTLGESGAKKFFKAMTKYARSQGDNGVKELGGSGIKGYMWEVKIKGKGGAYRLLGNKDDKGEIFWEVFERTHK